MLDLGSGSGLVAEVILRRIPGAGVVGVGSSPPMIELARRRLQGFGARYVLLEQDLREIYALRPPDGDYRAAISVQTLHNMPHGTKKEAFGRVHDVLPPGGLFLVLDRISVESPSLYGLYKSLWSRQERVYGTRMEVDDTFEEHRRTVGCKGDHPASLEQHLAWLRETGFDAACLHLHGNRALFAARKP